VSGCPLGDPCFGLDHCSIPALSDPVTAKTLLVSYYYSGEDVIRHAGPRPSHVTRGSTTRILSIPSPGRLTRESHSTRRVRKTTLNESCKGDRKPTFVKKFYRNHTAVDWRCAFRDQVVDGAEGDVTPRACFPLRRYRHHAATRASAWYFCCPRR
jgi:hypothetical protein